MSILSLRIRKREFHNEVPGKLLGTHSFSKVFFCDLIHFFLRLIYSDFSRTKRWKSPSVHESTLSIIISVKVIFSPCIDQISSSYSVNTFYRRTVFSFEVSGAAKINTNAEPSTYYKSLPTMPYAATQQLPMASLACPGHYPLEQPISWSSECTFSQRVSLTGGCVPVQETHV